MQEHVISLNTREKQIAKEKVALSRERLSIHNERKQIESRQQCSLCKTSQNMPYTSYEQTYTLPDSFLHVPVSRDYGVGNTTNVMSAMESDMAHLLGRDFGLRSGMNVRINNEQDKENVDDNLESLRRDMTSPLKVGSKSWMTNVCFPFLYNARSNHDCCFRSPTWIQSL